MAAKIMDPATGASTCALGSHRCRENIGTFTRKAIMQNKAETFDIFPIDLISERLIDKWWFVLYIYINLKNKGSDLTSV